MKHLQIILLFMFLFISCSNQPDPNLELFSQEAFAFNIGDYWEVNASINAKGFFQKEEEDIYLAKLSYSIDLITPSSDTITSVFEDWIEEESPELLMDTELEAQIEIDSSFSEGKYRLVFNVKDELYKQSKSAAVDFNLSK